MDKNTLVDYIKSNFPKVIFNPLKLDNINSKSIGFIISDEKLIIGYINKDGNLCKLFEPIDLNGLSNEKFTNILNRIPIVSGFDESNKTSLINLLNGSTIKQNSEDEHLELIKELKDSKSEYNTLVDSNKNNIILIKKEYESTIFDIKEQYNKLKEKIQELENVKQSCKEKLLNEKDQIIIGIKNYKEQVADYINSIVKSNKFDSESFDNLNKMYNKLLDEKSVIEKNLEVLTIREKDNLEDMLSNKNVLDNENNENNENHKDEVLKLNNIISEISKELESVKLHFEHSKLENTVLLEFKKNCIKVILDEKEQIIESIKDYSSKWLKWVENNQYNIDIEKDKLRYELDIIFTNLKKVVNTKNEYINSLDLHIKDKNNLISKLNNNISDIKAQVNESLNEQLICLSLKNQKINKENNQEINDKELNEKDIIIKKLTADLEAAKILLNKNQDSILNTIVQIDYNNCHDTLQKFINVNNMFYRKKEIIRILDSIINNVQGNYSNLNENMKLNIKTKFDQVKESINKHIDFLDLPKYINSPNIQLFKSKSTLKNIPKNFCIELNNISDYWDSNITIFTNQDSILTNIYEDLSGAVRVYIKIKPLLGQQQQDNLNSVYIENNTKKITVDCGGHETFGNFYGVFDESFTNKDVYTGNSNIDDSLQIIDKGVEDIETNHPGLYSTFKQVEDGYSTVIFGYGTSGSGKCLGINTPILMYDGTIKMVQDVVDGDLVMGDDSKARSVFGVTRGKDTMYKITNIKKESYIVNSEHILSLKYSIKKQLKDIIDIHSYQVIWFNKEKICSNTKTFSYVNKVKDKVYIEAQEFYSNIQDNLYIDIPIQKYLSLSKHFKQFLVGYKVQVEFPHRDVELDPYMVGFWLGDDTVITSEITIQKSEYGDGLDKVNSNYFMSILRKHNLLNNKHIPHIYKCNSREQRLQLLAGLIDANGHLDKNGDFEFTQGSIHEKIFDDVVYLCRSLGFACYKEIKKEGEAYRIYINGEGIEQIPTKIERKQALPRKQMKDVLVSEIIVEELYEDDYFGFAVDGNHRFLLGNFIVTHNTRLLLGESNSPGLIHYGLSNLKDVKNIKVKYLFEQYIDKFIPTLHKIKGNIINLVREVPQLKKYSIDETNQFSEYIGDSINLNNINVKDINKLTNVLESYRSKYNRIKKTPNNKVSSRSNLYIVFEIIFDSGKIGYITIVDTAGKESPIDIYNTFIDTNKGRINLTTLLGPTGGTDIVKRYIKDEYKDDPMYTPDNILEILKEGFYINECLNHLIYFFNKKNYKQTKISLQTTLDKYSESKYYINPIDEERSIDPNNNCLIIPILKFLDTLSNKKSEINDFRPTKFSMIICVRKEKIYCSQTLSSLKFAQQIKST